jgi:hypothetical protein
MVDQFTEPRIPDHLRAVCEFCKRDLNTQSDGVHQWTAGWVKNRSGGGGHGISLAVREKRWAHGYCVDRETQGLTNQRTLF